MDIELETTLLVDCSQPEAVMKNLAARQTLGPYEIRAEGSILMKDQYFDTKKRSLAGQGIALRLRRIGPQCLVCIKGKEHIHEWGGIERLEIEKPWSRQTHDQIISCLGETGLKGDENSLYRDDPCETFSHMGMNCIQHRQTNRIILDIVHPWDLSKTHCAEMALDRVCYRFGQGIFLHYELEIEAKTPAGKDHLETIADLVSNEFPRELRPWNHNKLVTGYAIETMLKNQELPADLSAPGVIGHDQYRRIEEIITKTLE
ncbi:MAG TPA: CYTH domain-containing protein [Deltaproteobacteria bacterium]|nr:CYTH domain-containing protein [Deltaproteobacteria bacterium]